MKQDLSEVFILVNGRVCWISLEGSTNSQIAKTLSSLNLLINTSPSSLLVSVLDSGASGPGSSSDREIVLCSWARHLTLTVTLSTQVYKWVPANLMLGGNPAID